MPPSPTRHRIALLIALVGVVLSAYTLTVDHRLASQTGYTSFCNLGGVVNCDLVIGSRYGRLAGFSVAGLGMLAFVLGALLAVPGAVGARSTGLTDLALLGLVSGSLGFALVLLVIQLTILRHLCLLCLSIDAVIVVWALTVLPLARRFDASSQERWWQRRAAAHAMAAGALVLAVTGGALATVRGPGDAVTVAEVQSRDPKFYTAYTNLPVRSAAEVAGPERHVKGPADAPVTIVEFSDFQCPACGQAFVDLRALVRSRRDVRVVFRYFPLDSACNPRLARTLHPDACLAASAAECAGQQQRFWEYHDLLFENQRNLDRDSLFRYAREAGLDVATFRACIDDPATRARIISDIEDGIRSGVTSTPTLFFNGRLVDGALEEPYYTYALVIEKHERDAHASRNGS
jgi:protein-disulfide isomerase/uncharacterized membrane protein